MACKPMQRPEGYVNIGSRKRELAPSASVKARQPSEDGKSVLNRPRDGTFAVLRRETGPDHLAAPGSPSNMDASIRYVVSLPRPLHAMYSVSKLGTAPGQPHPSNLFPGS
jgi:hypothetical protein